MSFAGLIGSVNGIDHEITERRVKISAYAETRDNKILIHITPALQLGPAMMDATHVRVGIYDTESGGTYDMCFVVRDEIKKGGLVRWGSNTVTIGSAS